MLTERTVEQFRFTCACCGNSAVDEYHVLRLTDGQGMTLAFFTHGGLACENPVAAENVCPACRRGPVHVGLLACRAASRS
jgi:hypothetical protein